MKFSTKIVFLLFFLATALVACQSDEAFVTEEDGLWNVVQRTTQTFENGVQTKDTTETDSLGQFEFLAGGGGYRYDKKGVRENIQWVVGKDDQITIYGSSSSTAPSQAAQTTP
jgi:outer membrane lipoprotein-sorting protein